ncbi:GatB/YqeY domain-containing protein [Patellaria atrata CBS 101060]|uniref:Altered inheritance of mitochondria protein 41 n=1 Tax=Patellaria atrata CBS 101060 TaxID=1346257 RepID=A0A9P4S4E7_9PEZI|nr:GatB/YqeY domain-containing protein [Patellaria atrata CBS 101060]
MSVFRNEARARAHRLSRLARLSTPSVYICPSCRFVITRAWLSEFRTPSSPLLNQLRNDLKSAMKSKNTNQLSVLRAILADITNASKTSSPITSDLALLALLKKRISASRTAAEEFQQAGRSDLVEKEEGQIKILEGYAGSVHTVSEEEIKKAVEDAGQKLKTEGTKLEMGSLMKLITGIGGSLDGKPVEKKEVARVIKDYLAGNT